MHQNPAGSRGLTWLSNLKIDTLILYFENYVRQ